VLCFIEEITYLRSKAAAKASSTTSYTPLSISPSSPSPKLLAKARTQRRVLM